MVMFYCVTQLTLKVHGLAEWKFVRTVLGVQFVAVSLGLPMLLLFVDKMAYLVKVKLTMAKPG